MTKQEAHKYLNRRLQFANTNRFNQFDMDDVVFIRNYIHHVKGKLVSMEDLSNSIQRSFMFTVQFDNLLNHIVDYFKIKVNWVKLNPPVRSGMEQFEFKVESYEFV